jgi:Retroviral aspartyl protease
MRINGVWYAGEDGIKRPVIRGEVLSSSGLWVKAPFLVDTGADLTVLSAAILADVQLQSLVPQDRLGGVGGIADSVAVETQIRFSRETRSKVTFRGQYAAVTEVETLDISVLGRDIMGLFSVIVDQPGNLVCLLGQRHRYTIEQS